MNAADSNTEPTALAPQKRPGGRLRATLVVTLLMLASLMAFSVFSGRTSSGAEDRSVVNWQRHYEQAMTRAGNADRAVLIEFTADWCPPCQKMNAQVYSQQRVADAIESRFVPIQVDLSDSAAGPMAIAEKWGVSGYPTLIAVDAEGNEIGRLMGFVPAEYLLRWIESAAPASNSQPGSRARASTQPAD